MGKSKIIPKDISMLTVNIIKYTIISILICLAFYRECSRKQDIQENLCWTWGQVIEIIYLPKSSENLKYEYIINNEKYFGSVSEDKNIGIPLEECLNYEFRVLYSKKNPENSRMLLVEEDYLEYDLWPEYPLKRKKK